MAKLAENHYGKSRVRLVKVTRLGERHELHEWRVGVYLQGEFERHFATGDNAGMMATDTMKNTVYSVAKESPATTMEEYALDLARLLTERNSQVTHVRVTVEEKAWVRLGDSGTAFQQRGPEVATVELGYTSGSEWQMASGVKGLVILKTAKSGFVGFKRDAWTTLAETTDRLLGTEATIVWTYSAPKEDYARARARLMETLLATFANHDSLSVQQTLFQMAEDALAVEPGISEIALTMPNRHNLLVDLARFGQENANEIFVPTDEPHGHIHARVVR
jgi:urate oxidase